jgi:hypothetical protein
VADHYDIRQEGHREAWETTPGDTGADWDQALEIAQERAASRGRNYVVRHVGRERTLLIVTATPDEGLAWPKFAVPPLQPGELDRQADERKADPALDALRRVELGGPQNYDLEMEA